LKKEKVGAYNWGFVAGKTNTIYPWGSWQKPHTAEPKPWFHDIFRPDGTPYDAREVEYIKRVTGKAAGKGTAPKAPAGAEGAGVPFSREPQASAPPRQPAAPPVSPGSKPSPPPG